MKTKSKIQKQREQQEQNLHAIIKHASINKDEYDMILFETACLFLEALYPVDTEFDEYRKLHHSQPEFWNWFRTEWNAKQNNLLRLLYDKKMHIDKKTFTQTMQYATINKKLDASYHENYINIICNK